ncbi:MAG: hypothetical protein ISP71_05470 [Flavobacteriales bacterium]|nr:hypothetical protein [Flavobacteriales bacterium]
MKNSLYSFFIILTIIFISIQSNAQLSQNAPNLTFTDLEGVTHNLHDYLDQGFKVILEYSYKSCYPCERWALDVGHPLWQEHGPNGDNTIRMFYVDPKPETDEYVAQYTQEWDIQYPVININSPYSEYPAIYFPRLYFFCPDKSYLVNISNSKNAVNYYLSLCDGHDYTNNIQLYSADIPNSSTVCGANTFSYSPRIELIKTDYMLFDSNSSLFDQPYDVQIFVNGVYHSTQTLDPTADGSYNSSGDSDSFLDPITVSYNDEVTFVIDFEGDNYPQDDTLTVVMPASSDTPPTASHNKFKIDAGDGLEYTIRNSDYEVVKEGIGSSSEFELQAGSCYSIVFKYVQHYEGALKNNVTGENVIAFQQGDFTHDYFSPVLFFNVISTVDIKEDTFNSAAKDSYFLNLLGKRLSETKIEDLPKGVYLQLTEYENGEVRAKKVTQNHKY